MENLNAWGEAQHGQRDDEDHLEVGALVVLKVPPATAPPPGQPAAQPPWSLIINGHRILPGIPVLCTVVGEDPETDTLTVATLGGPYGHDLNPAVAPDLHLTQPPAGALATLALSTCDVVSGVPREHLSRENNPMLTQEVRDTRMANALRLKKLLNSFIRATPAGVAKANAAERALRLAMENAQLAKEVDPLSPAVQESKNPPHLGGEGGGDSRPLNPSRSDGSDMKRKRSKTGVSHLYDGEEEEEDVELGNYSDLTAYLDSAPKSGALKSHLRLGCSLTRMNLPLGQPLHISTVESSFEGLALSPDLAKSKLSTEVLSPFLGEASLDLITKQPGSFHAVLHKTLGMVSQLWLLPRAAAMSPVIYVFFMRLAASIHKYPGFDDSRAAIPGVEGARNAAIQSMTVLCSGSGGRRTEEDKKCGELSEIEYYLTKELEISQTLFTACEKAMKDFAKLHKGDTGGPGAASTAKPGYVTVKESQLKDAETKMAQKTEALEKARGEVAQLKKALAAKK